ncbi:hypothetical protein EDC01DRAFT_660636 [Geopyxis carbonaria]|nr:hypothetical protein EDC01DRAFT_660636 [Geopyxis carbonaria]
MTTLSQTMPASTRFPLASEPKTGLSTTHIAGMLSGFPLFPSPENGIKAVLCRGGDGGKIFEQIFSFIPKQQSKPVKTEVQAIRVGGNDPSSTSSETGSPSNCSTAPTTPPTSPITTDIGSAGSKRKREEKEEVTGTEPQQKRQGIQAKPVLSERTANQEEKLVKLATPKANEASLNKKRKSSAPDDREVQKKKPNDWKPSGSKVKGLHNPSNYCYRNSVLQFLASSNGFVQRLATHQKQCKHQHCAACSVAEFFDGHFHDSKSSGTNHNLKDVHILRKELGSPFTSSSQQDASEYLRALLTLVEKYVTKGFGGNQKKKKKDEVHRSFGGSYKTTVTCPKCKNESSGEIEICPDLHLNHAGARGPMKLSDMIMKHFGKEEVEYTCEKCKFKNNHFSKQQVVVTGPEFLTIHLARHQNAIFSRGRIQAKKSMQKLDFPRVLSLGSHNYRLKSFVAHAGGSMNCGHYVAYVRQPSGVWAECNDESISPVNEKYVLASANASCQISILGYERMD